MKLNLNPYIEGTLFVLLGLAFVYLLGGCGGSSAPRVAEQYVCTLTGTQYLRDNGVVTTNGITLTAYVEPHLGNLYTGANRATAVYLQDSPEPQPFRWLVVDTSSTSHINSSGVVFDPATSGLTFFLDEETDDLVTNTILSLAGDCQETSWP